MGFTAFSKYLLTHNAIKDKRNSYPIHWRIYVVRGGDELIHWVGGIRFIYASKPDHYLPR